MKRVEFTKEMKKTHTILVPMMLPIHFAFMQNILRKDGYHVEILKTSGQQIIDEGLKNVHNDTCYPALLVIGQMIDALKSGNYDIHHVALAITQTGGGCRASNYIHLLRKALQQAGFAHVPVISVNFSKLERNSGFSLSIKFLVRMLYACLYADTLMWIKNQIKPYETIPGSCEKLITTWVEKITKQFDSLAFMHLQKNYGEILREADAIKRDMRPKIQVGIVGEIYMKYAPLGNGDLEEFLIQEGCEPVLSGVLDFALYCLENASVDHAYYNRHKWTHTYIRMANNYIQRLQLKANKAIQQHGVFRVPDTFKEVVACSEGIINRGNKMGEGWLLTSEMVALIKSGVNNIVCCQPFGCLPNHIVAKGMTRKLKNIYPNANIVAVDYDPSATKVNQENRLKLMLSNARLNEKFLAEKECQAPENVASYAYEPR